MASDPAFPIEIFPLILQHLQDLENLPSLARCSLVCKAFRSMCRKLLFQRVDLSDTTYHTPTRRYRLFQHLKRHSKVSKLIRHISYTPNGPETAGNEEVLAAFLDLPLVQSLTVGSGPTSQSVDFVAKKNGAVFKFGVCSLICSYLAIGNLTSLSLIAISAIPLFTIITSPNLKWLSIRLCTYDSVQWAANEHKIDRRVFGLIVFRSTNSNLPRFIHRCPQLRELEITSNSPLGLSRVTLPKSMLYLQELTLDTHSLSRCFGGLKNSNTSMGVDIKFPALHRLELHIGFTLDDYTYVRKMANYIVRHSPRLNELSIQGGT